MRNPWKLTTLALVGLLATSAGQSVFSVSTVSAEAQPKMREALDQLRSAAKSLEQATHDKGGHRAKALELTRAAIVQVETGVKFDNKN